MNFWAHFASVSFTMVFKPESLGSPKNLCTTFLRDSHAFFPFPPLFPRLNPTFGRSAISVKWFTWPIIKGPTKTGILPFLRRKDQIKVYLCRYQGKLPLLTCFRQFRELGTQMSVTTPLCCQWFPCLIWWGGNNTFSGWTKIVLMTFFSPEVKLSGGEQPIWVTRQWINSWSNFT